jgi:hypothetical protein
MDRPSESAIKAMNAIIKMDVTDEMIDEFIEAAANWAGAHATGGEALEKLLMEEFSPV